MHSVKGASLRMYSFPTSRHRTHALNLSPQQRLNPHFGTVRRCPSSSERRPSYRRRLRAELR